jgi:hypothetical protein
MSKCMSKAKNSKGINRLKPLPVLSEPDWIFLASLGRSSVILRGAYPKTYRRFAAPGFFVHSLLKASFQRSFTKTPLSRLSREKVFVNRIGFEPMTCCLEGSCSIQLSYRSGKAQK